MSEDEQRFWDVWRSDLLRALIFTERRPEDVRRSGERAIEDKYFGRPLSTWDLLVLDELQFSEAAILHALEKGRGDIVLWIVNKFPDSVTTDIAVAAATYGQLDVVRWITERKPDVSFTTDLVVGIGQA